MTSGKNVDWGKMYWVKCIGINVIGQNTLEKTSIGKMFNGKSSIQKNIDWGKTSIGEKVDGAKRSGQTHRSAGC